jgi:hypothetical protein
MRDSSAKYGQRMVGSTGEEWGEMGEREEKSTRPKLLVNTSSSTQRTQPQRNTHSS